jgi:hypothetical protein
LRIEPRHHFVLQCVDERRHDACAQFGQGRRVCTLFVVDAFGHAHHIAHRNAPALLGEAIAAARPAHAFENAGAHQLLHDLFEITLRHALARGDLLRLHRLGPRIERDVDHRFERKQSFAGEFEHGLVRHPLRRASRAETALPARAVR